MEIILGMKDIFQKFKINYVTYLFFFTFLITGHIKNIILIYLIVFFHELGHVLFLKYFKYPIESIEILPFGGVTKTDKLINTPINHDLVIYFGGVFFQGLLFLIFIFLFLKGIILESTYKLFCDYNFSILIFNLLPIRPLDGGELLRLFFEKKYSFFKAQKLSNLLSVLFLFIFLVINLQFNLNNYVIISFLMVKIYELVKKEGYYKNKFMLERLMYTFPYKKINNEKVKNLSLLKKDTYHFFKDGEKYVSEKELLRRKFDIRSYF